MPMGNKNPPNGDWDKLSFYINYDDDGWIYVHRIGGGGEPKDQCFFSFHDNPTFPPPPPLLYFFYTILFFIFFKKK